jgi:Fur family ferric uptake transcriptional regulator
MALEPLPPQSETAGDLQIVEPLCAVFRQKLKGEGLKYTPERARVLDAIVRSEGLFQAEPLIDGLKRSGLRVSKATVYRTIRLLMDAGIVQRVPLGEDEGYYQLVYGRRPHDLLIRLDTPAAETIDVPELVALRDRLCRERGLEARGHRFMIFAVKQP